MSHDKTVTSAPTTAEAPSSPDPNDDDVLECTRLREFKDYLQQLRGDVAANVGGVGTEVRACQTRNNNETHPVSVDELHAEVTATIWTQLQLKRCPRHFQLALLRAIEQECLKNANDCDFAGGVSVIANNNKTDDDSPILAQADKNTIHFDLVKLQKFIVNHVEKMLTQLTDNAQSENLKNFAEPQTLCKRDAVCNCKVEEELPRAAYVESHIKNKPRKMEDRHVCLERFGDLYQLKEAYSFYGVFDGHSGPLAASYVTAQLPYLLAEQLRWPSPTNAISADVYREAFEAAFLLADAHFARKRISSGTTAVCALLAHPPATAISTATTGRQRLFVAWVGDSKALLVSPAACLQLVKPHKPDATDERKRIEAAGGAVMFVQGQWRVNGILNVARSIGDYSVDAVIAEPDFVDVELSAVHDFLVLGSDGLWDHVAEASIVETVYAALATPEHKIDDIPKMLIELAKQGDSQDNITVVVIFLKERSQIVEHYKSTTA